ncbi:MAG TPA: M4 family metallopeptidase [Phnomibacter sp.]|nr:M4 family metallopeptidase [Phnomibacter sp.]
MKKILLIGLLCICQTQLLFSQKKIEFENELKQNNHYTFAKIKTANATAQEIISQLIKNDKSISYKLIESKSIDGNLKREKYQLLKNTIKVRGGEYVITYTSGIPSFVNGFLGLFETDTTSNNKLSKQDAIHKGQNYFNENGKFKSSVKNIEQVYYFNYSTNLYTLSYEITIVATNSLKAEKVFLSCTNGTLLGAESLVCNSNFPGIAQTQYNGVRNIVSDANTATGPFRLQEIRNGVLIRTRNNNNQFLDVSGATEFWDNDNNLTFAEHGNDRAAFDAHWGAETVLDYWRIIHNRNSINDAGMNIESFVHVGSNLFNAFWFDNKMYYGDGIGGTNALTSLDICSHEFGHGIDEYTGNLAYERESGALDEGFADIWAACVEAWTTPLKQRWLIGEDVLGGPIRSMADPNLFGQPDTYLGTNWVNTNGCAPNYNNDYCGVHTNSGVLNYWFFLLSEGGNGTNDIGNTFSINGLGINAAAQIAYRTKLLMNNSLANYPLCRQLSIQAATQLFGNCSNEVAQVTNAWFAVGVGAEWTSPFQLYATYGQDCNSITATSNFPSNSNVTWTTTNGLLINGNSSPFTVLSNTVTISSPNGTGGGITASIGGSCFTPTISFCPCVPWNNPVINWIYSAPTTSEPLQAEVSPAHPDAIRYEWYINGQLVETTYGTFLSTYNWPCTSEGEGLSVIAVTSCGTSAPVYGGTYSPICYPYRTNSNLKLYPNPASSEVVVRLEDLNSKSINRQKEQTTGTLKCIIQITIIDKMGITRKVLKFSKGNILSTFNVSDLPSDIYYLDISDGSTHVKKPLVIRR